MPRRPSVCRADLKLEVKSFEQKMDEEEDLDALENLTLQSINLGTPESPQHCDEMVARVAGLEVLQKSSVTPSTLGTTGYGARTAKSPMHGGFHDAGGFLQLVQKSCVGRYQRKLGYSSIGASASCVVF